MSTMFEQTLNDMTAAVHVHERQARLADEHGVRVQPGTVRLTFAQASELVLALDRRIAGGFTYKHIENRMRALRNSLLWAFGPEGEVAYASMLNESVKKEGKDDETDNKNNGRMLR